MTARDTKYRHCLGTNCYLHLNKVCVCAIGERCSSPGNKRRGVKRKSAPTKLLFELDDSEEEIRPTLTHLAEVWEKEQMQL